MKCPKCNYTSFDYLESCKKCGADLRDVRSLLQIIAVSPEDQAPAAPAVEVAAEEPLDEAAMAGPAGLDELQAADGGEEILEGLDFEGSFDEIVEPTSLGADPAAPEAAPEAFDEPLVEHTSYADQEAAEPAPEPAAAPAAEDDEDELLDLDFGDLFEEKGE